MFKKLKLNVQINIAFGAVLFLIVIISLVSYNGLTGTFQGFNQYRGLAKDTELAGEVQSSMLSLRLSVQNYLNSKSKEQISSYDALKIEMNRLLNDASVSMLDPDRALLIEEVKGDVAEYDDVFIDVIALNDQYDDIIATQLDPPGQSMLDASLKVIEVANNTGDLSTTSMASELQKHLLIAQLYVTRFLVSNAEQDTDRALDELNNKMPPLMRELKFQLKDTEAKQHLTELESNYNQYRKVIFDIQLNIIERNDLISYYLNDIGPAVADKVSQVNALVNDEQNLLGQQVETKTRSTVSIMGIISIIALVGGLVITLVMVRLIRRPIGGEPSEIAEITRKISNGDLGQNLPVNEKDTGIYKSVCEMSDKLRSLVRAMVDTSSHLTNSAQSSSSIAENNVKTVSEQKELTDQVVVAIEEMAQSFQEVVRHASESADRSDAGMKEAMKGRDAVKITVDSVNNLESNINDSMVVITQLESKSQEIGSVVQVIQGISEQTNLLALNAAIEAARAGEMGRGFAVVADEVRSLAQRTNAATAEIQQMIDGLQEGTANTVKAMEKSTFQVGEAVQKSNDTDNALSEIYNMISDIADMNTQVAAAVEEQSAVAEDISKNMNGISQTFEETADSANKAQSASEDVNEMAKKLSNLAAEFKV